MKYPKWWEFWKADPEPYTAYDQIREEDEKLMIISEPVRSIVKAIISDRKRFIIQSDENIFWRKGTKYEILDIDTEEEFSITLKTEVDMYGYDTFFTGPRWAAQHELKWAYETVANHYYKMKCRANRIITRRERNRLIEIYK